MPVIAVAALVGILLGLWAPLPIAPQWLPVLTVLIAPFAWWLGGKAMLIGWLGCSLAGLHAHGYAAAMLHPGLVKQDVVVTGYVADFPRATDGLTTALFRVSPEPAGLLSGRLLQLRVYDAEPRLIAGAGWRLLVRLKQPRGTVNPGSFDRESWYLQRGISAIGYVRASALNKPITVTSWATAILRARRAIREQLTIALRGHASEPVIAGVVVGARDAITARTWEVLRLTGTSHLMAISGLHVGLLAVFGWYLGYLVGWGVQSVSSIRLVDGVARGCSLFAAIGYTLLAGFTVPTVRACIMVATVITLGARCRQPDVPGTLAIAVLVILCVNPLAVLAAGFWLSFLAVAVLAASVMHTVEGDSAGAVTCVAGGSGFIMALWSRLKQAVWLQFVLIVALALPTVLFFGQLTAAALPANFVAIPLFSIAILPLVLAGAVAAVTGFSFGAPLLRVGADIVELLFVWLDWLAGWSGLVWQPASASIPVIFLLACTGLCVLLPRPLPGRLVATCLLLLMVSNRNPVHDRDLLRITVLDVGQGLAVVVTTRTHTLLYDTGARWRGGDMGRTVVLPYFDRLGVTHLDALVLSHGDSDHSGGVAGILRNMEVQKFVTPANQYPDVAATECRAGLVWVWDDVKFSVLHPESAEQRVNQTSRPWSDNNSSCVLLIEAGGSRVLLPGDIERPVELKLLRQYDLSSLELVVAAHHGSKTSSAAEFVAGVNSRYVVFSSGYANRWGFPAAVVSQRWQQAGTCELTTANTGSLDFRLQVNGSMELDAAQRASWTRPWILREPEAGECSSTINGLTGGV